MEFRGVLVPAQVLYTIAVVIAFVIVVGIVWYFMSYIIGVVQVAGRDLAVWVGSVDATYVSIDTFITGVFTAFLVIALLVLAMWVWHYTQIKGRVMPG